MKYRKIVFLIDDDADDQEIFSDALQRSGREVECVFANDGIHALEKIQADITFVPDLIFIDLNMPRMNGQECLHQIKKIDRLKSVPIYMYSTTADPSSIHSTKELGAVDFIVKPTTISQLTAILSNILKCVPVLLLCTIFLLSFLPHTATAQKRTLPPVGKLKKLSVEELMNIQVTSVTKTAQKLTEVASAIQVITNEDIQRSPTTLLPEVLRLASNLQVTRSGSHEWSVTSRGFNGAPISNSSLADKLLVMVDGRVVYNQLFSGVYWDVQHILKDDIDRIEVVSGPGGTLWGANAVNGVINIITKSAKETQGFNGAVSFGNFFKNGFAFRYGSNIDSVVYFRVHANRFDYGSINYEDGSSANDQWDMTKAGFRMDIYPRKTNNQFTLQGDFYMGNEDSNDSTKVNGQNVLGRWKHNFSTHSNLTIQGYFDRTWRNATPDSLGDEMTTFDLDIQHDVVLGKRNRILWGTGYRNVTDKTTGRIIFSPANRTLHLFNAFLQDQVTLVPKKLELTLGTKLLHNEYTGFEWQPSVRLALTPVTNHTLWAAVSKAVRTPSRFDRDLKSIQDLPTAPVISEKVWAYELGYRIRPAENISFSLATFYNNYYDLRSIDSTGIGNRLTLGNSLKANSWGLELSGNYVVTRWWRMRGGLTYMGKKFMLLAKTIPDNPKYEAIDPAFNCNIQSIMDLPGRFEVDLASRYVSKLEGSDSRRIPDIPAYFALDIRVGWNYRNLSVSISAQNITDKHHIEFGSPRLMPREIPRSIHVKVGCKF
ncbi:MAG: response regulator [Bacteroidetes bacterium]|nr:response regulator [Bacteroidota bacterium]